MSSDWEAIDKESFNNRHFVYLVVCKTAPDLGLFSTRWRCNPTPRHVTCGKSDVTVIRIKYEGGGGGGGGGGSHLLHCSHCMWDMIITTFAN